MRRTRSLFANGASPVEALESRRLLAVVYPSDLEQYMVELINHARANPAAEASAYGINLNEGLSPGTISSAAKQPLAINPELVSAATTHTQDMLQNQTFSHTGVDGSSPYDREISAGYDFAGSWGWGENIAYRSDSTAVPPPEATAQLEEQDLFADTNEPGRGHRLNLLNPAFKEVGVGMLEGRFNNANALMTTEDFADTSGNSFLTGVVFNDANGNNFYDPGEGLSGATITAVAVRVGAVGNSTQSWTSGGYTLQLTPGVYDVTASGGPLATPITYTNVVIGSVNVEIDFNTAAAPPVNAPTPTTPTPTASPAPNPAPTPTPSGSPTATPSNPLASGGGSSSTPDPKPLITSGGQGVINGHVYEDLNDNRRVDPGEIGAPYMTVFLDTQGTAAPTPGEPTATTNIQGQFQFVGIPPGKYQVVVVVPDGWRTSTGATNDHLVTVHKGRSVAKAGTFFITPTVYISGALFNDLAGAGTRAAGDKGISGWQVYLDLNNDGIHQANERAATTGHNGAWSFGDLSPGTYTIRVILHKQFVVTTQTLTVGPLTDGEVSEDNLIGVHR